MIVLLLASQRCSLQPAACSLAFGDSQQLAEVIYSHQRVFSCQQLFLNVRVETYYNTYCQQLNILASSDRREHIVGSSVVDACCKGQACKLVTPIKQSTKSHSTAAKLDAKLHTHA